MKRVCEKNTSTLEGIVICPLVAETLNKVKWGKYP